MSKVRSIIKLYAQGVSKHSTIITSQYPVSDWHTIIGEQTVADYPGSNRQQ